MDLKKRILEIAFKNKLSHLGSYLSSLEIIEEIYKNKKSEDIFILSSGHAALALYVVLEAYEGKNAEELFKKHGEVILLGNC
jgi:transketolase N-terminal domain/subunit